ncbi:MAG: DUF4405 domain-containing protein [Candidatus Pacearchaeota archaeon]
MEKIKLNYIIDFLMGIFFIITFITALVIFFFFSCGMNYGDHKIFLGIKKRVLLNFHNYSVIIFFILVIIHFILHWKWIVCMTKNIFYKKNYKLKESKK